MKLCWSPLIKTLAEVLMLLGTDRDRVKRQNRGKTEREKDREKERMKRQGERGDMEC